MVLCKARGTDSGLLCSDEFLGVLPYDIPEDFRRLKAQLGQLGFDRIVFKHVTRTSPSADAGIAVRYYLWMLSRAPSGMSMFPLCWLRKGWPVSHKHLCILLGHASQCGTRTQDERGHRRDEYEAEPASVLREHLRSKGFARLGVSAVAVSVSPVPGSWGRVLHNCPWYKLWLVSG